jgi:DNA polymerase III delta subunit
MLYLLIGQDSLSKDIQIKRLKQEFLARDFEQFNLDILYAKELTLKGLQERLLCLPLNCPKRLIVIKEAQNLKEEVKEFILKFIAKPNKQLILVLDITRRNRQDEFINRIYKYAKVLHFKEIVPPDTFTLSRQINLKRPDYALRILNQLLKNGEKPERILGGLRYSCQRDNLPSLERKKRLRILLNCDIEIKTGKLKAPFALEKLIVSLCASS